MASTPVPTPDDDLTAPDRCSFDMHARFSAFSRELEGARGSGKARALSPTTRVAPCLPATRSPRFVTLPRSEGKLERQTAAARQSADNVRAPFRAPSAHQFREATPARWRDGRDFVAKFALPSKQDLRRHTALNQEGFFGAAPGEDTPAVSRSFKEQILQQQQRLHRLNSPASPSAARSVSFLPSAGVDGNEADLNIPRSPDAFHLAFRSTPEHSSQWLTG